MERFDASIGAGTVYDALWRKIPANPRSRPWWQSFRYLKGKCDAVTMMSYGFDPYLSSWSPYHGAVYAVLSSVAKIAAAGGDYRKIRFTFQEYFQQDDRGSHPLETALCSTYWAPTTPRWASAFRPSAARTACPVPSMRRRKGSRRSADTGFLRRGRGQREARAITPEFKKAGQQDRCI